MDKKHFIEIIEEMSSQEKQEEPFEFPGDLLPFIEEKNRNPEETALTLKEYFELFKIENVFEEGELVSWKRGLKNRRRPKYNEPAIVIKVLDEPIFSDETKSGSPYFREPLDIVLGVMINEKFEIFYYDKRRLTHFEADIPSQ